MRYLRMLFAGAVVAFASSAGAALVTDISGGSPLTVNGARFEQFDFASSGTGTIDPFLRIQAKGTEQGYNTDGLVEFDTKVDPHTHSQLLGEVPRITVGPTTYYEFLLDTAEPGEATRFITLDELELYLSPTPANTGYPALGSLIYDLDSAADVAVKIDGHFGNGNGSTDARVLIPAAGFDAYFASNPGQTADNTYLYLFAGFSDSNGSFEEFSHRQISEVPEPSTSVAIAGVVGIGLLRRRRVVR